MTVREISYIAILPIWETNLWPDRTSKITPCSSMLFPSGNDVTIHAKFTPTFYGYYDNGQLIGVNSGHKTNEVTYRSRGLWVNPEYRGRGIGKVLLNITTQRALDEKCIFIWTMPKQSAIKTYETVGFNKVGEWLDTELGKNCYAFMRL